MNIEILNKFKVRFFTLRVSTLWAALFVLLFYSVGVKAQETIKHDKNKKTVRIDIARNGLHCPFLGPQLKENISQMEGVENVNLNSHESYIEFVAPAAKIPTEEVLIKMANDLGYPLQDIKVSVLVKKTEK